MDFPKNYKFEGIERKWQSLWQEEGIYNFDPDCKKPIFSVDTPPPTISSDYLHVGHAMSYCQADFIARYQRMKGCNVFYPMGFDDNGLPSERYVEKKYGLDNLRIRRGELIELCLKETKLTAEVYKKVLKSLGISVDWSLSYSTIAPSAQKAAQLSFLELYEKGLIERRKEPVQWCTQCQTSVAQADVVIEERASDLYDLIFESEDGDLLTISTTRPELIGACVALYAHPEDKRYVHLRGKKANVPLFNYYVPIKFDESVDPSFGTGLMMVCTWGDAEDVRKWKEHKLDTRVTFNSDGTLTQLASPYQGLKIYEARQRIINELTSQGFLKGSSSIKHNIGIHDRCNTPIEYALTPQWFIKILDFKQQFLARGDELRWYPEFMKIRYREWVANLRWDWNVSRQRYYGVPFPVWYCDGCGYPVFASPEELPVDPLVDNPRLEYCPKCEGNSFSPETSVMDTWMVSSLTPLINGGWAYEDILLKKIYPMSLRPQGFEIIRTWLFYTIVKSHFHTSSLPWESVMISGWGLDKHGRKMSKSLGNFVMPEEVITKYSADALRYWAAGATLGYDQRFNEEDVANGKRLLTKLWNAARFFWQNCEISAPLGKFEPTVVDKWALSELQAVISEVSKSFESYEHSHALKAVERFFWTIYCDNYLEIVKERFRNPEDYGSQAVLSVQNTMYRVFLDTLKLFAPFLPYITEEIYSILFKKSERGKSIHLSLWPEVDVKLIDRKAEDQVSILLSILRSVRKYKSDLNIHQNHWVSELTIRCSDSIQCEIEPVANDLKSASRARTISFDKGANMDTENPDIKIGIRL